MSTPAAPPQFSPDGHWWWTGTEWVPADQAPGGAAAVGPTAAAPSPGATAEPPVGTTSPASSAAEGGPAPSDAGNPFAAPAPGRSAEGAPASQSSSASEPAGSGPAPGFAAPAVLAAPDGHAQAGGTTPAGYPPYPGYAAPAAGASDGKAIASLILGLLWLAGLGSIAAVILGHLSRSQAKREGRAPSGLALAGLILGYLGIAGLIALGSVIAVGVHAVNTGAPKIAAVQADLRAAAAGEETYFTDHNTYAPATSLLEATGYAPTSATRVTVLRATSTGYCLRGAASDGSWTFYFDPQHGGLTPFSCG